MTLFYIEAVRFGKKRGSIIPCTVFTNYDEALNYIKLTSDKNTQNGYTLRVKMKVQEVQ